MGYRIPPIHCLTAFEAVARLRSAVQAAGELNVTPSAISHRIRQLEELLGNKLFTRAGGDFALTVEGREYLDTVREALDALGRFPASDRRPEQKKLRLAVTPTFARQILMPRLHGFASAYPEIELVLQVSIPLLDVTAEDADLEIRYGSGPYKDMEAIRILADSVTPMCSPNYLRDRGPFSTSSDFFKATLLRSPLEPWRTWFAVAGFDPVEPRVGPQFNDVGLMYDAAANGQGIALARVKLARMWTDAGQLVRLSEKNAPSPHSHFLCYRKNNLERYECAAFAEWLQMAIADLQTETVSRLS
jgi:LysR family glycine cleavage system transcriptional activator